jgi:alanine dehydrogenase
LPEYHGDFRAMPAYNAHYNLAGVKWVNSHRLNSKYNLPAVRAIMIVNDPKTATPLAIIEASEITNFRTGASGALAVKYLTQNKPLDIACVGAGRQAYYQLMCINEVRKINSIVIIDINLKAAETLANELSSKFANNMTINVKEKIKNNLKNATVVISTTPSKRPLIFEEDIASGVLINAIGADAPGKQELDHNLIKRSLIVVDDYEQAIHSGEINTAITSGNINKKSIYACMGELIYKKNFDKFNVTKVFDSTGLAIQDLALAGFVLKEKAL